MSRVLFDVNVPRPASRFLAHHGVEFADQRGWRELTNGDLLATAEREGFDRYRPTLRRLIGLPGAMAPVPL